jgi:osmoprotectant transport system ATP-binding protein
LIRFRNVSKSYDGGQRFAVRDVTLRIEAGEWVALLGASGSGKTTTLKLVNRLLEPTSGSVEVAGQDVARVDPAVLRRGIGYVFQGVGLFPHLSVAENVAVVPELLGWPEADIRARVDELLRLVRLAPDEYRARRPRELSGGQRQRVGFARALAARPQVLLLDEPFGALDPVTRDDLRVDVRTLQRALGVTTLLVTHDMAEALLMADRIVVMDAGRVLQIGTPRELVTRPADDTVARLLAAPRRQTEALEALLGRAG